jgi:hypothetical protein
LVFDPDEDEILLGQAVVVCRAVVIDPVASRVASCLFKTIPET